MRDKEPTSFKEAKDRRHNENLHGAEGFDGLTGRYKGIYYERGVARPRKSLAALISPISMFRDRQFERR